MTRRPAIGPGGRRGFSVRGLMVAVVLLLALPAIGFSLWPGLRWSRSEDGPMMHLVERSDFVHEITDRGNVESASNVEIRCEVQSQGTGGTTILEVIPEGTYVKPDDLLVRLDSSSLEDEQTKQQISVNNSEAEMIQARNVRDTAVIAKKEYEEGVFVAEQQKLQAAIEVAEEKLRRAQDYLAFSKRLAEKGYVTKLQLEGDQFAVTTAQLDLDKAKTDLKVLEEFTCKKMLIQLDSDIRTAEAKLRSAEASYKIEVDKLNLITSQIEKCTIRSHDSGQVVYANVQSYRGNAETIIEEGATVRENQVIIRLPDPKRMQVAAKIAEGKVTMVKAGMPARIRLDAFPDAELVGTVEKVNDYPEPTPWYGSSVKEYETIVKIHDPPKDIRPGLTAEVKILIERLANVVHVPVQAVFEHGGKNYCVVPDGRGWKARQVQLGASNDKTVVILKGLEPGESIVLNSSAMRGEVNLPALPAGRKGPPGGRGGRPGGPSGRSPGSPSEGASASPSDRPSGPRSDGPPSEGPSERGGPAGPPSGRPQPSEAAARMLSQFDKDGDGKLSNEEVPERMRPLMSGADEDGDGKIDRSELIGAMSRMPGRGRGPGGPDGTGGPGAGGAGGSGGAP